MNTCGDSTRVVHPLFQVEDGGSIPTSPLQFEIEFMPMQQALELNKLWHSRLPDLTNWHNCKAIGAFYENKFYAVALWGPPVARAYNGLGIYELRRMAIAPDAPTNTGSRMLRIMRILIKRDMPEIKKLISYQDTEVHRGIIYKSAGWSIGGMKKNIGTGWNTRQRNEMQATGDKVRWEYAL